MSSNTIVSFVQTTTLIRDEILRATGGFAGINQSKHNTWNFILAVDNHVVAVTISAHSVMFRIDGTEVVDVNTTHHGKIVGCVVDALSVLFSKPPEVYTGENKIKLTISELECYLNSLT